MCIRDRAKEDIDSIYKNVHSEAANAVYNPETKEVTPSVTGYDFDVAAAKQKYDAAQMGEEVVIDLNVTQPFVSGQSTEEVLFKDVLYTIDTPIQEGYPSKIHNISLACQAVNGKMCIRDRSKEMDERIKKYNEYGEFLERRLKLRYNPQAKMCIRDSKYTGALYRHVSRP